MEGPVVAVSLAFRKQVPRVMGSIILFMLVYLLLVAAAVVLAIVCFWLGLQVMMLMRNLYGLIAGLGLMAVGVSVLIFLVKFVFAVARDENSQRVLITEAEQPRLFAFIREITEQTGTKFPQKIFLVPDVNAAVFYNSSFWSMFLPIRKNLQIGLGLVNSVNLTEFKAVMAHEFGHFSQRSMKLGSFTYNVNKVIHNLLYENTGYTNFLQGWGKIHGVLGLFAMMTAKIAGGIQWVLRGVYTLINKTYMGLSREMEFHADAVAASVAGGNNVISSLSRIEVAADCYQTALNEAGNRARENRLSRNLYANQLTVFRSFGVDHRLPSEQGIPTVSYSFVDSFSRSRINFKNQWASHPSLGERKQSLDALGMEQAAETGSAWTLFDRAEALQERMTANLYGPVEFKGETKFYESGDFEREFGERKAKYALPAAYKRFYFGRYIDMEGWDIEALAAGAGAKTAEDAGSWGAETAEDAAGGATGARALGFDDLFNEGTGQLQQAIDNNHKDIELAMAIKRGQLDTMSFDFDGVKYDREDGEMIAEQLKKEVAEQRQRQTELDQQAFLFFVRAAGSNRERLIAAYREFQGVKRRYDGYVRTANGMLEKIRPLYSGTIGLDAVTRILGELKTGEEPELKRAYRELLADTRFGGSELRERFGGPGLRERMQKFVEGDWAYFVGNEFMNHELDELRELAIAVAGVFNDYQFFVYKRMLEEQLRSAGPWSATPSGGM